MIPDEDYQISDNNLNYFTDMDFQQNMSPSDRMSIDALEQQFDMLHGNSNFMKNDTKDPAILKMRKTMNSHDFKYSMIPFSIYNNSQEVNLYH